MFHTLHARLRDRGFSFIELLAYMAIAALLILAAVPQFNQYRQKAVVSNMRDTAHNASLAAEAANIDAVSARAKNTGSIQLASARIRLTASTSTFDAIRSAVAAVKPNAGEAVAVTDQGATNYLITVTSSKIAATTKVVYASTYATADGINLTPGTSTIVGGKVAGTEPTPSGTATPSPQPTQEAAPDLSVPTTGLSVNGGDSNGDYEFSNTGFSTSQLTWQETKTFDAKNVHIYVNGEEIKGAATGTWTLAKTHYPPNSWAPDGHWGIVVTGRADNLPSDKYSDFVSWSYIKFVDGSKVETVNPQTW